MANWQVVCADVLEWAAGYDGPKFHAILCDPPYHLVDPKTGRGLSGGPSDTFGGYGKGLATRTGTRGGFMGKEWDGGNIAFQPDTWRALAAHLLPGGHLLACGGTRTYHRLACAIEDAGLEIRDSMAWCYGQGFPKSHAVGKAIDRAAGAERIQYQLLGQADTRSVRNCKGGSRVCSICGETVVRSEGLICGHPKDSGPATPAAAVWEGYGTALKPAWEPIVVSRKPIEGTIAANCQRYGAGALNIDGGRVGTEPSPTFPTRRNAKIFNTGSGGQDVPTPTAGRWPANFVLSHVSPDICPACSGAGCEACNGEGIVGGCRRVGTRRVKTDCGKQETDRTTDKFQAMYAGGKGYRGQPEVQKMRTHADADGLETVDDWICQPECACRALGEQSGERPSGARNGAHNPAGGKYGGCYGSYEGRADDGQRWEADTGTASRFFFQASWELDIAERLAAAEPVRYCAKAGRRERDAGLEGLPLRAGTFGQKRCAKCGRQAINVSGTCQCDEPDWISNENILKARNPHPTVKPLILTRYLATLLLPPPSYAPRRILVPFAGSGSEMIGALLAGWDEVVGIEMEADYCQLAEARCKFWQGWQERGYTEPKEILKTASRGNGRPPKAQMELDGIT